MTESHQSRTPWWQTGLAFLVCTLLLIAGSTLLANHLRNAHMVRPHTAPEGRYLPTMTVAELEKTFADAGYDIKGVRKLQTPVARLFVPQLPPDWINIRDLEHRKDLFVLILLPLVYRVNEEIYAERAVVEAMKPLIAEDRDPTPEQMKALDELCAKYNVRTEITTEKIHELLMRIDHISPVLTIAMAVEASNWGASRHARRGNALFLQKSWDGTGTIPTARAKGDDHRIRTFPTLMDCVRAFALNLNTNKGLFELRNKRAVSRTKPYPMNGRDWSHLTINFRDTDLLYPDILMEIIANNRLEILDRTGFTIPEPAAPGVID